MPRPGVDILTRDAPPSSGLPVNTGTAFIVGLAEKGPHTSAGQVRSIADFKRVYGARQTDSELYDAVDTFFREGGGSAYIGRIVGPAPVRAFLVINDATAAPTLRVEAKYAGAYANSGGLKVQTTVSGGNFTVIVFDSSNVELERGTFASKAAAIAYAWTYIQLVDADVTKGNPVAVAATNLAGGTDDRAAVTTATKAAALALFLRSLGPGQVLAPGDTATQTHTDIANHCAANNRVGLLDLPTGAVATTTAAAASVRALANSDYVAMWVGRATVPGITPNTTRSTPLSAVQAGLEARRDRVVSPNVPAAGRDFSCRYALDVTATYSDTDRLTLLQAGVNTYRVVGSALENYGYRSAVDPAGVEAGWTQFNTARLRMAVSARGEDIGESFVFDQIDGRGRKAAEFGAAITGMLLDFYIAGSLYGDTPEEAFAVEVGPSVNTAESIAAGELRAVATLRVSPHAELVVIEFVKTPITEPVGG